MRFLYPSNLSYLIPVLFLLPLLFFLLEKRAKTILGKFASESVLRRFTLAGFSHERRRFRMFLGVLAAAFAVVALARPQAGTSEETVRSEGLDFVFLLDVSNSMLSEDVAPNRLKKAKHMIRNFVDRLSGDRVGVVAFAGSAYAAVPLTTDYDYLKQNLDIIDETSISNQGSNLARGLDVGIGLLLRGGALDSEEDTRDESGSRAIIVFSDGESTEGEESEFVQRLKKLGIRVFSIGIGSFKGTTIPMRDENGNLRGYKRDKTGNMVLSKLESANLEGIASKTDGKFYSASTNEGEIEEIVNELSSSERRDGANRKIIVYDELFQYPLALAVICLLLLLAISEKSKKLTITFFAAVSLSGVCADGAFATNSLQEYNHAKKGLEAYQDQKYSEAADEFGKAQAGNPDSNMHHMNLGGAQLKASNPEAAVREYSAVLNSADKNEASKGAFNLGKSYEAMQNHEMALRSYQKGLELLASAEKPDAEVRLRLKKALESAQQQKQNQKKENKDQQGDGKGKDENKNEKGDQKDKKNDKKKEDKQNDPVTRESKSKPEYTGQGLTEQDARRIIKQMQEQEKKTQQRLMRAKTQKSKDDKKTKDW